MVYQVGELPQNLKHLEPIVLGEFVNYDTSKVDAVKINPDGTIIALGITCTDPNCDCTGGWWEKLADSSADTIEIRNG